MFNDFIQFKNRCDYERYLAEGGTLDYLRWFAERNRRRASGDWTPIHGGAGEGKR